ncbi:hypothetical protein EDEG_01284 [Edhazardia aedis USNM 41457]|uniref:FAR-17a/AIG1-like protein n=1 Tax=Edhazardia aedis (strain USNM 41457) TaxID=1003232 RepID=J9D9P7_EDHAE|nr:hypothetical protein EDEG_01284 [Edhazardia aedis USNM 41457]|eukprot:EJW04491.1 hypothetical protein EDEG_01284 [Edhazardia aedis USNM 41457]
MLEILCKILGIFICIFGAHDDGYPDDYKKMLRQKYYNQFQYLTVIGLYMSILTLFLGLKLRIIYKLKKKQIKSLYKIYTKMLSLILPIEILISLVFWSMFIYNPVLIVKESIYEAKGFNFSQNMCLHLFPAILLAFELKNVKLKRSNVCVIAMIIFSFVYYFFCRYIAKKYKSWPYPFLDQLNEARRIVFFAVSTFISIILHEIVILISRKLKAHKKIKKIEKKKLRLHKKKLY